MPKPKFMPKAMGPKTSMRAEQRLNQLCRAFGNVNHGRPFARTRFTHDRRAMVLDGALADAELPGDDFTRRAIEHHFYNLVLSRRESSDPKGRIFPESKQLAQNLLYQHQFVP